MRLSGSRSSDGHIGVCDGDADVDVLVQRGLQRGQRAWGCAAIDVRKRKHKILPERRKNNVLVAFADADAEEGRAAAAAAAETAALAAVDVCPAAVVWLVCDRAAPVAAAGMRLRVERGCDGRVGSQSIEIESLVCKQKKKFTSG